MGAIVPANFTLDEWKRINNELDANEIQYGMPARVYGLAVLGSFSNRKLGAAHKRTRETWRFLGKMSGSICSRSRKYSTT